MKFSETNTEKHSEKHWKLLPMVQFVARVRDVGSYKTIKLNLGQEERICIDEWKTLDFGRLTKVS